MKNEVDGGVGMNSETADRHTVADGRLLARLGQTRFPLTAAVRQQERTVPKDFPANRLTSPAARIVRCVARAGPWKYAGTISADGANAKSPFLTFCNNQC